MGGTRPHRQDRHRPARPQTVGNARRAAHGDDRRLDIPQPQAHRHRAASDVQQRRPQLHGAATHTTARRSGQPPVALARNLARRNGIRNCLRQERHAFVKAVPRKNRRRNTLQPRKNNRNGRLSKRKHRALPARRPHGHYGAARATPPTPNGNGRKWSSALEAPTSSCSTTEPL